MIQAIVYTSQTGHTEEYAHLLSEATGLPAYPLREAEAALPGGTEIAYFGWVMANSVQGYRKACKRFSIPMLCAVGMAAPGTTDQVIRQRNTFPEDVALFTLQGGLRLDKLRGLHRLMMRMIVASARKTLMEKNVSPAEEARLQLMVSGQSHVSLQHLQEPMEWLRSRAEGSIHA